MIIECGHLNQPTLPVSGLDLRGPLPEREHVCLGAGLQEGDLQGPVADRVVRAYEVVEAAVGEAGRIERAAPSSSEVVSKPVTEASVAVIVMDPV